MPCASLSLVIDFENSYSLYVVICKMMRGNGHVWQSGVWMDVDSRCDYTTMTQHRAYLVCDGDPALNTSTSALPRKCTPYEAKPLADVTACTVAWVNVCLTLLLIRAQPHTHRKDRPYTNAILNLLTEHIREELLSYLEYPRERPYCGRSSKAASYGIVAPYSHNSAYPSHRSQRLSLGGSLTFVLHTDGIGLK